MDRKSRFWAALSIIGIAAGEELSTTGDRREGTSRSLRRCLSRLKSGGCDRRGIEDVGRLNMACVEEYRQYAADLIRIAAADPEFER
jgi:hypothetical protein